VIRPIRNADIPALRRFFYDTVREMPAGTEEGLRHWVRSPPERARLLSLVAIEDGELVGFGDASYEWQTSVEDAAYGWVVVREDRRGQGIGRELAARVEEHLAEIRATKVETHALEGSPGQAFAERRGFRVARREIYSGFDPRDVDVAAAEAELTQKEAEGFRVGALAELRERPRELHALDAATTADVPEAFPQDDLRYEEWLEGTFAAPDLSWEGSRVVFAGERPVAFTLLQVDSEMRRAESDMTGTLAEFRGRGLARLAKLSSLLWAAEHGIEDVSTGNDATNAAMLAVNRRLGYRERAVRAWLVKEL
jgi:GNAT superfamily N-acetyltransferase